MFAAAVAAGAEAAQLALAAQPPAGSEAARPLDFVRCGTPTTRTTFQQDGPTHLGLW